MKGRKFGKISYQNSGRVAEVSACGNYFRLRWTRCPPAEEYSGELSKKRVRWDQLLLQTNQEDEELLLQQYLMVDSYNTGFVQQQMKSLEKVWRRRKRPNGELEVLCTWVEKKAPSWRNVFEVAETPQYELFLENVEYWEAIREQNRVIEEEEERYVIERIFYRSGTDILVLWENYDEPCWVPIRNVQHLEIYKKWKNEVEDPFERRGEKYSQKKEHKKKRMKKTLSRKRKGEEVDEDDEEVEDEDEDEDQDEDEDENQEEEEDQEKNEEEVQDEDEEKDKDQDQDENKEDAEKKDVDDEEERSVEKEMKRKYEMIEKLLFGK
jgi:hypothetical protein